MKIKINNMPKNAIDNKHWKNLKEGTTVFLQDRKHNAASFKGRHKKANQVEYVKQDRDSKINPFVTVQCRLVTVIGRKKISQKEDIKPCSRIKIMISWKQI